MNMFELLIQDLSKHLGTALHAEKGYICKLRILGTLRVQIEHEASFNRLLIASFLCELPPGKFREDVLKEGLKENNSLNRLGVLAYSEKNNSLAYFLYLPETTASEKVSETLLQFIEKAKAWKTAVETGQMHLIMQH